MNAKDIDNRDVKLPHEKTEISRETYKRVKNMNRLQMDAWIYEVGKKMYLDALRDAAAAEMTTLKDEFGFGTKRLAKFMERRESIIDAINEKYITANEIFAGLIAEGIIIVDKGKEDKK